MNAIASVLFILAVILWATPVWFSLFMEMLFRCGIGYRRQGKVRRITMIEWLNAIGVSIFLGSILYGLARLLQRVSAGGAQ